MVISARRSCLSPTWWEFSQTAEPIMLRRLSTTSAQILWRDFSSVKLKNSEKRTELQCRIIFQPQSWFSRSETFPLLSKQYPASNHAERMVLFLILCTNLNQRLPAARREHYQIDRRSCRFFSETRCLWKSSTSFPGSLFFLLQRTWNDMKGEGGRG